MKKTISILAALLISMISVAQDSDPKAKEILDKVSAKMEGWKTLKINFGVTIYPPEDEPISQKGIIYVKGDKYMLDITDQEIYCDGINITSYLKEDNECYKSKVADAEEEIMAPTELLTIWEDGYKYRYDGEQEYSGANCHSIFLYPKDPAKSPYHTIKLLINIEKMEVVYVYLKGKDGTNMKYKLVGMERDVEILDSKFTFNEAEHPGVECYDE